MKSAFLANFIKLLFNISQVCLMAAEAERLFPTGNEPHRNLIIREGPPRPFGLEEIEKAGRRLVALRNATMAIGRSRRPRGPTYARGANRSQFEDPELAVNARHLATRRAHPAFKFFTSLIPEAESFNLESFVPATTGGLEEHMLPPQMSG
jgi:hypothetical protein